MRVCEYARACDASQQWRTGDPSFQKEELCLLRVLMILSLRVDSGTLFVSRESGLSSSMYSFKGVTFQGWK